MLLGRVAEVTAVSALAAIVTVTIAAPVLRAPSERVLGDPQDAYTRELLTAIPHPPLPV